MNNTLIEKPRYAILLLVVLSLYIFFFKLDTLPLTDPDETFYAQTAREMVERNEWITPYLHNEPQFEKPILFYWLLESSYKLFGINESAARLPSAVLGLIGVLLTYFLGMLLFDKRTALLAGIIAATNAENIVLARACVTDMALAVGIVAGLLCFFYAYRNNIRFLYLLSSFFFGCAVLTKGPIGIVLPLMIITAYLVFQRDLGSLRRVPILPAIGVFILVAVPWYAQVIRLHGSAFIDTFFGFHNIIRFLEPEHKIGSQVYYYIPVLMVELFPWSAALPLALIYSFKRARKAHRERTRSPHAFLLSWFLVFFIFFSVSRTKLPTYIFPAFAPLALIIAAMWNEFLKEGGISSLRKGMRAAYISLAAASVAILAGTSFFLNKRYPAITAGAMVAGLFLTVFILLSVALFFRKRYLASFSFIVYAVIIFLYPLNTLVLPEIGKHETGKIISRKLLSVLKEGDKVGSESHYREGLAFYTGKEVADLDKHHNLVTFLNGDGRVYCVLKEKNFIQLYTLDTRPFYTSPSYMIYKVGKKVVITNKMPENGRYMVRRERQ